MESKRDGSLCMRWKDKFNNIKVYAFCCAITNNSNGMFWYSLTGILTSIERRYNFDSATTGRILMASELGPLSLLLFISHFSNRFNMPRILATLYIFAAVFIVLMTLPHYVIKSSAMSFGSGNQTDFLCVPVNNESYLPESADDAQSVLQSNNAAFGLLFAALFLFGTAISPAYTLQFSYLESNTKKVKAALYIALASTGWSVAPILGLLLSAWATSQYVDLTDTYLRPNDPAWVGAWWLALLIVAACLFVTAPFFYCFPRRMKAGAASARAAIKALEMKNKTKLFGSRDGHDANALEKKQREKVYSWKGFFMSMKRLVTNPCYMVLIIGYVFWGFSGWGFASFFPKYCQVMFSMQAWEASIATGLISGIGFGVGRIFSGVVASYFKLSLRRGFVICTLLTLFGSIIMVVNMFLGCDNVTLRGLPEDGGNFIKDLSCADGCACSGMPYSPVCDSGVTYFSPCHAGCLDSNLTSLIGKVMYTGCNCTETTTAVSGVCDTGCGMLIPYTVSMVIAYIALAFTSPLLIVFTMRCVDPADKTLAYGLAMFIIGLAGWLPAPSLFGSVIDTTCSVWRDIGGGITGSCWAYDLVALRYRLQGMTAACRCAQLICYTIVYVIGRKKFEYWEKLHEEAEEGGRNENDAHEDHALVS